MLRRKEVKSRVFIQFHLPWKLTSSSLMHYKNVWVSIIRACKTTRPFEYIWPITRRKSMKIENNYLKSTGGLRHSSQRSIKFIDEIECATNPWNLHPGSKRGRRNSDGVVNFSSVENVARELNRHGETRVGVNYRRLIIYKSCYGDGRVVVFVLFHRFAIMNDSGLQSCR